MKIKRSFYRLYSVQQVLLGFHISILVLKLAKHEVAYVFKI